MPRKPAHQSSRSSPETAEEDLIYRVFSVELRDVLHRLSAAIDDFLTIVRESFQPHPHKCYVSGFWNERAAHADRRIASLLGDAQSLLDLTIDSFGKLAPIPSEPFTCQRVSRPRRIPGEPVLFREPRHVAATIGWMTPNERRLNDVLRARLPVVLETRGAVESRRTGLCVASDADGAEQVWNEPALAEADVSIANYYPMLVKPDMARYEMAVSNATVEGLELLAGSVRRWEPRRESARTLDPEWQQLVHTYLAVIHPEPRFPANVASGDNGDENPASNGHRRELPAECDGEYRPATWFPKGMADRLRQAASKNRKSKRVATRTIDGVVCYSVANARQWWPKDVPKEA